MSADEGYKYLGIIENRESKVSEETFTKLKIEILSRVRAICKTNLNGKNSIKALNEYALSVINYYVGVVPIEPKQYKELDDEIRKVLIDNKLHYQPACKERLYLPRKELGRGLDNLVHKSERMQLDLLQNLEASKEVSLRRKAILQTIRDEKNFLSLIDIFLIEEKWVLTKIDALKKNQKTTKKQRQSL